MDRGQTITDSLSDRAVVKGEKDARVGEASSCDQRVQCDAHHHAEHGEYTEGLSPWDLIEFDSF